MADIENVEVLRASRVSLANSKGGLSNDVLISMSGSSHMTIATGHCLSRRLRGNADFCGNRDLLSE